MEQSRKIEILAPAGNYDSLISAVVNGADAVYLGASAFSARAKAGNFTQEELERAVRFCHLHGVKVYLAVNTVIKPVEYENALTIISNAKNVGVDAFIIQDMVFLQYLRSTMPDIIVHLSTQAGIHNLEGAKIVESLGVSRVVLSRETLLDDIVKIKNNTNLEIEYFVHGALCVSFSGNCYLSSLASGLSGNRGRCLQFCRKKYSCKNQSGYLLSPKDFNMTDKISDLIDAGVSSLKIEGRMRRAEYVGEAVRHYKDLILGKKSSQNALYSIYNRGDFCHGYLDNPTESLIYPKLQGHKGVDIGRVVKINGKFAQLRLKNPLESGDGLKFLRNGYEVGNSLVGSGTKISKTGNEYLQEVTYVGKLKVGDCASITTDISAIREIEGRTKKIPVDIDLLINCGELTAIAKCDGLTIETTDKTLLQSAKNNPLTQKSLLEIFAKTGKTQFLLNNFTANVDGDYFAPKSLINEFRRNLYLKIEDELLKMRKKEHIELLKTQSLGVLSEKNSKFAPKITPKTLNKCIIAQTNNPQIALNLLNRVDYVAYFPKNYELESVVDIMEKLGGKGILSMPIIARGKDIDILTKIVNSRAVKCVIANNAYTYSIARGKKIIRGCGLNVINPQINEESILSVEYDGNNFGDNFVYCYGKFPVMTFTHCPKMTINDGKCISCNQENIEIADENGNKFTINFYKIAHCYSQMLNTVAINGLNFVTSGKIKKVFLDFVDSNASEIEEVLSVIENEKSDKLSTQTTGGYFTKKLQ